MSKEWFIKEGGQVCFKSDNAELNGWDIQSLVDCLNGKEIKITELETKLAESDKTEDCEFWFKMWQHQKRDYNRDYISVYKAYIKNCVELDQLKQQLEEKDKMIEELKFANKNLDHALRVAPNANEGQRKRIVELKEINHKLKQELKLKDKEIEKNDEEWREICDGKLETINRLIEENHQLKQQLIEKDQRILELKEQLKNSIVLPCIKKHITYLDVDSELVKVDWYVIYKQKDYDEIFTIKCSNEEDANQELKRLKGEFF